MISLAHSFRRLADVYFPLFVSHVWSSTIFLLLVLAVIFLIRGRLTASARFSLCLIGILKFAIPSAAIAPWVRLVFSSSSAGPLKVPLQFLGGAFPVNQPLTGPALWPAAATAIWLTVAMALIARHALIRHRLVALSIHTAVPPQTREAEALTRARRRLRIRQAIDIVRSALPEAPAVLRILRPLIVLPAAGCDDLSDEELESLLSHECAHIARHDNLIARIESVICALFWFHPLIWIAQRITVIERERACDEAVADSAERRETYLAALTKFCHASIAPRLPGVSCMATAKLKERMDHVMKYPALKAQAPSPKRVALLATSALILFTAVSGIVGTDKAFAGGTAKGDEAYAVKITAMRAGGSIVLQSAVTNNKTHQIVGAPKVTLDDTRRANMKISEAGVDVTFEVRPDSGDRIAVDVTIEKEGEIVQRNTLVVAPSEAPTAETSSNYTGQPISLDLKDADLRDVIGTFGKITGLEMRIDDSVQGKVSVNWHNVPWDQAFDSLLKDNGLTYRIESKTIIVSKK
jgi:beta-lactamase regulating signal transducer with metallopeptidase domain